MHRRAFLTSSSTGALALTSFSQQLKGFTQSLPNNLNAAFSLVAMSRQTTSNNLIIFQGTGSLEGKNLHGSGTFSFFEPTGILPYPIYNHGTWSARQLIQFQVLSSPLVAQQKAAALLEMRVNLQMALSASREAHLKIRFAGFGESHPEDLEGLTLVETDGTTFQPVAGIGGTLLTLNHHA